MNFKSVESSCSRYPSSRAKLIESHPIAITTPIHPLSQHQRETSSSVTMLPPAHILYRSLQGQYRENTRMTMRRYSFDRMDVSGWEIICLRGMVPVPTTEDPSVLHGVLHQRAPYDQYRSSTTSIKDSLCIHDDQSSCANYLPFVGTSVSLK